jgi:SAM-dependent methyltransferase
MVKRTDYNAPGFAGRFVRSRGFDEPTHRIWVRVLREAADGATFAAVLDLGAGTGRFWPVLREAWLPSRIIAVECSSEMLFAAVRDADVEAVLGDIDDLPATLPPVDACLCSMVLHYSRDATALCGRLFGLLRTGGIICVRTATQETIGTYLFARLFPTALAAERAAMPRLADVVRWLAAAGFTEVRHVAVPVTPASSYLSYLRKVIMRGYPSLQLVSQTEFAVGFGRLALTCLGRRLRGVAVPPEHSVLVTGRRP